MEKIKILIAENDEDEQFFMREGFEDAGCFNVLGFASSGDELLTFLDVTNLPDIVLSDLNMPGKNGYDILKELRGNHLYSNLPIVITSTSSVRSVIDKCMELGATKFIQKPETFVDYPQFAKDLAAVFKTVKG